MAGKYSRSLATPVTIITVWWFAEKMDCQCALVLTPLYEAEAMAELMTVRLADLVNAKIVSSLWKQKATRLLVASQNPITTLAAPFQCQRRRGCSRALAGFAGNFAPAIAVRVSLFR